MTLLRFHFTVDCSATSSLRKFYVCVCCPRIASENEPVLLLLLKWVWSGGVVDSSALGRNSCVDIPQQLNHTPRRKRKKKESPVCVLHMPLRFSSVCCENEWRCVQVMAP